MQEQYMMPELRIVGKANEVVLGSLGVGGDIRDELLIPDSEFQRDQEDADV